MMSLYLCILIGAFLMGALLTWAIWIVPEKEGDE